MDSLDKLIGEILDPANIEEALAASQPETLKRVFDRDPGVRRLVEAGQACVPAIQHHLRQEKIELSDITLACFAYLLAASSQEETTDILGPAYVSSIERPLAFFTSFAAVALRKIVQPGKRARGSIHSLEEHISIRDRLPASVREPARQVLFMCGATERVEGLATLQNRPLTAIYRYPDTVEYDPDIRTCEYVHFDLSREHLGNTWRYNCHGFTFLPRKYLVCGDVDAILEDNFDPVDPYFVRPGDVVRYRADDDITHHTGRVWSCPTGNGNMAFVRSKIGAQSERIHDLLGIPSTWGQRTAFFRQKGPLRGLADLWIRDSWMDNGEQYSLFGGFDTAPILLDPSPFDEQYGNTLSHGSANRISVRVENRGDREVTGARVRYYWADPTTALAPGDWKLIPASSGAANPTVAFDVPAHSSTVAPHVEWTPAADPSVIWIIAVVYCGDDPRDSGNPDPLVYPFSFRWDNNIAARQVQVVV